MVRIGIDLGGTKTEILALDEQGHELLRRRIPTPSDSYSAIVRGVSTLVQQAEAQLGTRASVGIGTPGSANPRTGAMRNANTVVLNGQPLQRDIESALGRGIRLANDADCFALSEAVDGAGADAEVVFGVIIGTGCGGGVVVRKSLVRGHNGIAGEWGHAPLPWASDDERPGPSCYCGKQGCIETFVSGTGLCRDFQHATGRALDGAAIAQAAQGGDAAAEAALGRYEQRLARALAPVINLLDPDLIVLGGGASNLQRLYETVPRLLPDWVFSDEVDTPVVPAKHGDSSGVRGAAWLW